ncbi:DUF3631 domain-containing protein [Streptomyces erythrochromogenes]|uniref:DUF3631 domain-containing protein n=1 Tax=Streptomyces erythrochromogenes TaxID=285574 RepID=UPI0038284A2B
MTIPSQYDLVTPIVEGILEGLLDILEEARCEREGCSGACQAAAPDRAYSGCARGSGAPAASPSGCACRVTLLELLDGIRNMKPAKEEAAPSRCCSDQKESSSSGAGGTGSATASPRLVVECLNAFGRRGNLEAMASVDLVGELTTVPGVAGKGWTYADITPVRLAKLLAPYGIHPRNMDLSDGRRRKAYSRRALVRALYSQPL